MEKNILSILLWQCGQRRKWATLSGDSLEIGCKLRIYTIYQQYTAIFAPQQEIAYFKID